MSDLNQARRKFKVKLIGKQDTSTPISALMGRGDGTVSVPNQAGQVYIRVGNQENYGSAYNDRVPLTDNLPVFVGYDPVTDPDRRLFQVLTIRQSAYVDAGNPPIASIGPHHTTHEFGGGDDVYIGWRRLMGLRVGRPVGFVVTVDPGYIYRGTTWIAAPVGASTADLTAQQAALVGAQAQYVLISLSSTGAISVLPVGTIKASPALLLPGDIPTPPAGNIPLAAVKIYAAQTAISDSPASPDIIDLRFPTYATMNNGGVAGLDTEVQYNNAGVFGANANLTWKNTLQRLEIGGPRPVASTTGGINLVGDDARGIPSNEVQWYYGTASNPSVTGRRARGTIAAPLVPISGDVFLSLSGGGFIGPTAVDFTGLKARVAIVANETWSPTANGTRVEIMTTPNADTTPANVARFDSASGITNLITNTYTTKDGYILTAAKTGTLPVGTGTAGYPAFWSDANQIYGVIPNTALNLLLPSQAGQSGNVLGTDGANTGWVAGGSGGGGNVVIANLPCGAIIDWSASALPQGWLECDGSAVSRTTYADLYAVVGDTFGAGDGSTTFNLPNVKSRVIVGRGQGSGLTNRVLAATGGEETHVLTEAELAEHAHAITVGSPGATPQIYDLIYGDEYLVSSHSADTGTAGSDAAHENMPPFLVLVKIIKYTNAAAADIIFDDLADPEDVSLAAADTGDDVFAARRDHIHYLDASSIPAAAPAAHDQNASTIIIPSGLGSPTYDDVQDFLNTTRSAGRLTGGAVSKGTGATISITPLEGMIFTGSTLGTSPLIYFKMPQQTNILATGVAPNLIDNSVNWIYVDYAGGVPVYKATIDRSTIDDYTMFSVGRVWVSGTNVEVQLSGHSLYNKDRRSHNRLILKYGGMDRISGANITAHATPLRLTCDAGSWYIANTAYTTPLVNQFSVMYRTGGGAWTQSALLTLFSEVFDGGTSKVYETYQNGTSLGGLTGNHYGVYWIFICPLGHLIVVLGDNTYSNIGSAQAATIPASLPARCTNWSRLIGRVIIKKTAAAFYSVESVWTQSYTLSAATDHASLFNLAWASSAHTGTASRVAAFDGAGAAISGALIPPATNVLTLTATAASTLGLAITAGKTLTLTAVDDYNLTVPATGVAALLATANAFTAAQTITVGDALVGLTIVGATEKLRFFPYVDATYGAMIQSINAGTSAVDKMSLSALVVLIPNSGLHVGGVTDPGDNNLTVDGSISIRTGILTPLTVYGTAVDVSTSADNGLTTIYASNGVQLSIGMETASPYGVYLQTKDAGNAGPYHYPILLNPVDGNVGIATAAPTISDGYGLHIGGHILRLDTAKTPASHTDTGNVGEICWDDANIYVCTAANHWRKAALADV